MKKYISWEWYPVFELDNPEKWHAESGIVEIPDDKCAEYERLEREFDAMQHYLAGMEPS